MCWKTSHGEVLGDVMGSRAQGGKGGRDSGSTAQPTLPKQHTDRN